MKEELQEELNVAGNPGGEGSTEEKGKFDLAWSQRYAEMETEIISMQIWNVFARLSPSSKKQSIGG